MTCIHEKAISVRPGRIIGIKVEKFRVKNMHEVCTSHWASWVTGVGFFNHGNGKYFQVI